MSAVDHPPRSGERAPGDGEQASAEFEPHITAFVCNWCTYTGADLAGTSRLHMASYVRIIRLPCTGRIDHVFIVKAFERGADGVIVSGCHPADCHYTAGNYHNETVERGRGLGPCDAYHGLAGAATPADDPFAGYEIPAGEGDEAPTSSRAGGAS